MIDLFTWFTPNGRKVSIMLEEIGMEYEVHSVNIGKGCVIFRPILEVPTCSKGFATNFAFVGAAICST